MVSDTITAIATSPGNAGVGIVRISGPLSLEIAHKIIDTRLVPRHATHTRISTDEIQDDIIAIYFKAPNSFTGEDVVEFQCHGGQLLLEKVNQTVINFGARLATAGEFTRRALLNGKISLDRAESLINIIHAESEAELVAATAYQSGEFAAEMKEIESTLIELSALVEATLDHPEEIPFDNLSATLLPRIKKLVSQIEQFTNNIKLSDFVYNGVKVAIIGRPNVGKSSLFNRMLGTARSIVTDIAGTTTDIVSETIQIQGFKIRLLDTAGIRTTRANTTHSKIEKIGIERSIQAAHDCDIAIIVSTNVTDDREIIELVQNKSHIVVETNCDVEKLKKQIIQKTLGNVDRINSRAMANTRQLGELTLAKEALISAQKCDLPDILASDMQTALFHIGNITGTNATEAVLDEIFSRFCLGK